MHNHLILFVLTLFTLSTSLAQNVALNTTDKKAENLYYKADDYVKKRDFNRALESLSDATRRDPDFAEAYIKAANLHKLMGNKAATFDLLQKGLNLLPFNSTLATNYYTLAELHFDRGNYIESQKYYNDFVKADTKSERLVNYALKQLKTIEFALKAKENPVNFDPQLLPPSLNKFALQYFPATTADRTKFIYTARAGITPSHDENIFISELKNGNWQPPVSISNIINTTSNEGAATISGDGKTLVFAACNRPGGIGDCDLYISSKTGKEWSKAENMGKVVNSSAWDSQPTLSADGRTLYFTSNRGGGIGKEDIWVTYLQEDESWKAPQNLGPGINTPSRDMAPYIHGSGTTLYFVSDGHLGMGGLDVFLSNLDGTRWSEPRNLGYPLNTQADEGSLFITPDNQKGYYSRQGLTNPADSRSVTIQLYEFSVPESWKSKVASTYAQGRVFNADTKKPIGAKVQVYDVSTDSLVQQVSADKITGDYTVVLTEGKEYALYVNAPNYLLNSFSFDYSKPSELSPVALDVYLKPIKAGAAIVLNNLFFDSGAYKLQEKSKTELNRLIHFMRLNNDLKIEIAGHTDNVGTVKDNQLLSERRAKAVVDYLSLNGIPKNRLSFKGLGESEPVEANSSEANRQLNRRIELRVK
jgi:OmpA-OmpF porin, OOP family